MQPSPPPSPPSPRRVGRPQGPLPVRPVLPIYRPVPRYNMRMQGGRQLHRFPMRRVARPVPVSAGRGPPRMEHMYPHHRVAYQPPRHLAVQQLELPAPLLQVIRLANAQREAGGAAAAPAAAPGAGLLEEEDDPMLAHPLMRRVSRPAHRPHYLVDNLPDHAPRHEFWIPPELLPAVEEANIMVFDPEDPFGEGHQRRRTCPGDKPEVLCPPRLVDIAAVAHAYVSAEYFEQALARELYYVGIVERLDEFLRSQWEPLSTIPWLNFVCHDLFHDLVLWLFNFSCDRSTGLGTSILVFLFCVRAPKIVIQLPRQTNRFKLQGMTDELRKLLDRPQGSLHTLNVTGLEPASTADYLKIVLPRCTSLKVLVLGSHATRPVLMAASKCPLISLETDVEATDLLNGEAVEYLLSSGPDAPHAWYNLVTLSLNNSHVTVLQLESLLTRYVHLKTLKSSKHHIFEVVLELQKKEHEIGYVREPLNLRYIFVRQDWRGIVSLPRIAPKVSHLEIRTYFGVAKEKECMNAVANMRNVISLTIQNIATIGLQVLQPDVFLPVSMNLQELKFDEVSLMSLTDVLYILMACPNLISLALSVGNFDTFERDLPDFSHQKLKYLSIEENRKEPCYLHAILRRCPCLNILVLRLPYVTRFTEVLSHLDSSLVLQSLEVLDISRVGQVTPLSVSDMKILCCRKDCECNPRRYLFVGSKIHPRSREIKKLRCYWWVRNSSLEPKTVGFIDRLDV